MIVCSQLALWLSQSSHRFAPRLRGQIILGYIFTITVRACLNAVTSVKISKVTL